MTVRKTRAGLWEYDFSIAGERYQKGRYKKKAEAVSAEENKRAEVIGRKRIWTYQAVYDDYMAEIKKGRAITTVEAWERFHEKFIREHLAHLYIEEITRHEISLMKRTWPAHWEPKTVNQPLILVRAVLRHAWDNDWLVHPPKVPMEQLVDKSVLWYEIDERDTLLQGVYDYQPQWYFFFYLTTRLGLRTGEMYPIEHEQFRIDRLRLVVDRAAERGTPTRPLVVKPYRKARNHLELEITEDIATAYLWHCEQGYAGERLVFCPNDEIPRTLDSHRTPLKIVLAKLKAKGFELRRLTHHKLGRHSVGSQANEAGASPKAIQTQLGHRSAKSTQRYIHGGKTAQREIVEKLRPARAPHEPQAAPQSDLN